MVDVVARVYDTSRHFPEEIDAVLHDNGILEINQEEWTLAARGEDNWAVYEPHDVDIRILFWNINLPEVITGTAVLYGTRVALVGTVPGGMGDNEDGIEQLVSSESDFSETS
jgi:hypothetical protein